MICVIRDNNVYKICIYKIITSIHIHAYRVSVKYVFIPYFENSWKLRKTIKYYLRKFIRRFEGVSVPRNSNLKILNKIVHHLKRQGKGNFAKQRHVYPFGNYLESNLKKEINKKINNFQKIWKIKECSKYGKFRLFKFLFMKRIQIWLCIPLGTSNLFKRIVFHCTQWFLWLFENVFKHINYTNKCFPISHSFIDLVQLRKFVLSFS